ncbi:DUF2975 domain-containing protein [Arthrobacter sp. VKM Ac-2550]|uniref:DUF2975 domain-containing protein n=1 Tax=Crystallibacter permensis TaxID=1938888 RepID=UPI0022277ABD|nr:DUF2975 domain-containing protein [Arthrobacter sp. VKM Ac-2550]MCW2131926.1 Protein of unknown function (DUF2975) [Arthrobacter sp. VKM Ac-2550]
MIRQQVARLRIIFGAFALGALLAQLVVVPLVAADYAEAYPEVAYLAPPYVTAIVVAIGGFEVALLAAWQLLSAAVVGEASAGRSKRWANVMAVSLGLMAVLFAGVCVHAGSFAAVGGPPMLFGLLTSLALVPVAFGIRNKALDFLLDDDAHRVPR